MLTERTRKIVEAALGRPLTSEEEAGYPELAQLPVEVIASARRIREASNLATVSVYLQHLVPSAGLDEVKEFIDALPDRLPSANLTPALTEEDRELAAKWHADREKRMQKRATEGAPPRKLPPDSPIFKKWDSDPFPGGPDFADSVAQVANVKAGTEPRDEQKDVEFFLDRLINGDARARAVSLNSLAGRPRADERLLAACERLLEDRTIALLGIPYEFGEIRWVAADAVASMRALMGRTEVVVIEDAFAPVASGKVDKLAIDAGVPPSTKGGIEGDIETLERIAAAGKLPRRRITREPWMPPQS